MVTLILFLNLIVSATVVGLLVTVVTLHLLEIQCRLVWPSTGAMETE